EEFKAKTGRSACKNIPDFASFVTLLRSNNNHKGFFEALQPPPGLAGSTIGNSDDEAPWCVDDDTPPVEEDIPSYENEEEEFYGSSFEPERTNGPSDAFFETYVEKEQPTISFREEPLPKSSLGLPPTT